MHYGPILKTILTFITFCFSTQLIAAITLIAGNDQPAAGFEDHSYFGLSNPSIGPSGHVAFFGSAYSSTEQLNAVWSGLPSNLRLIIKENDAITGFAPNILFDRLDTNNQIVITKSGNLAFSAYLKGAAGQGLIAHVNGENRGILLPGDQAPGFPPGFTINPFVPISNFAISDAGMVIQALVAPADGRDAFVGFWFWDFNTLELIKPPIADCNFFGIFNPVSINQSGTIAFASGLLGDLCPVETAGIFRWQAGTTEMVLSQGDAVPGMVNTEFDLSAALASVPGSGLNTFTMNDSGEIFFAPFLRAPRTLSNSIWVLDNSNTPRLLTLDGEFLPGNEAGGFIISPILTPRTFNNNGFSAGIQWKQDRRSSAILIGNPRPTQPYSSPDEAGVTQLSAVAQLATESPPGFDETFFFSSFVNIFVNNANQFAFGGTVTDARNPQTSTTGGIWRGTSQLDVERVAYAGMPITVNGNQMTLDGLGIDALSGTTVGGYSTHFDDNGQIIFSGIASSDSSPRISGIFLVTDNVVSQEERIFSLAEQKFANLFAPANPPYQTAGGFLYRFYSTTNTYIGIKAGEVFVLGAPFGPDVLNVGATASVLELLESR